MRTGQRHANPGLQDAVTMHHALPCRVVHGAVERMSHRADEYRRRIGRKGGVGIERDHVLRRLQPRGVATDHGEGRRRIAAEEAVELLQLPAFALPAHPHTLFRIPAPRTVQQEEDVRRTSRMALIQRSHAGQGRREDLGIILPHLACGVGEVAQHGEMQVVLTIREELHLEILQSGAYIRLRCRTAWARRPR